MSAESWLEILPVLALVRGVPVVTVGLGARLNETRWVYIGNDMVADLEPCRAGALPTDRDYLNQVAWDSIAPNNLRIDLDDPQGQRYAVSLWINDLPTLSARELVRAAWVVRLLLGAGTLADRVALAGALAGVTP
jgi:hypothetical protein